MCVGAAMDMKKRALLLLSVVLSAASTLPSPPAADRETPRPNILWIVADDLGWGDLGFRNGGQIKTPVLDNFVHEGTVLTNYYVQASCSPSRATFMTGRYPRHHGLNSAIAMFQPKGLALNETTAAQLFRGLGYKTHAIGKWHIGSLSYYHTPTFRGFQSFYGFYGGIEDYKTHEKNGAVDLRRDVGENCGKGCSRPAIEDVGNYSTQMFTDEAVRIIGEDSAEDSPWFMYLAYQAVHFPGQVPQRYSNQYEDVFPDNALRVKYAGMLTSLDEGVGEVLDAVNRAGQLENTVVVFTTDNGGPVRRGASNSPLRGTKGELWEGGTRGTAMVRGPGVAGGTEYASLMHAADWLPTLLGAAGKRVVDGHTLPLDGLNLWDGLRGREGARTRKEVLYGNTNKGKVKMLGPALRVGDYKLLVRGPEAFAEEEEVEFFGQIQKAKEDMAKYPLRALYNLKLDPSETNNLAVAEPQKTRSMLKRLKAIWNGSPAQMDWQDPECAHPMNKETHLFQNGTEIKVWEPECDHLYAGIFSALPPLPVVSHSAERQAEHHVEPTAPPAEHPDEISGQLVVPGVKLPEPPKDGNVLDVGLVSQPPSVMAPGDLDVIWSRLSSSPPRRPQQPSLLAHPPPQTPRLPWMLRPHARRLRRNREAREASI